jgi:hypothetical protein
MSITFMIDQDILSRAVNVGLSLCEGECVHVHDDKSVTTGTDFETTWPKLPGTVVWTYHPSRASDVWDCFVRRQGRDETVREALSR